MTDPSDVSTVKALRYFGRGQVCAGSSKTLRHLKDVGLFYTFNHPVPVQLSSDQPLDSSSMISPAPAQGYVVSPSYPRIGGGSGDVFSPVQKQYLSVASEFRRGQAAQRHQALDKIRSMYPTMGSSSGFTASSSPSRQKLVRGEAGKAKAAAERWLRLDEARVKAKATASNCPDVEATVLASFLPTIGTDILRPPQTILPSR